MSWFPPVVQTRYNDAPVDAYDTVQVDAVSIDPSVFLAPDKSPLTQGDAVVFEQDALVYLRLFTM